LRSPQIYRGGVGGVEVKDGVDRTVYSPGNVQVATGDRGVRC